MGTPWLETKGGEEIGRDPRELSVSELNEWGAQEEADLAGHPRSLSRLLRRPARRGAQMRQR